MIRFKSDKQQAEWSGYEIDNKIRKIVNLANSFCSIESPDYPGPMITDLLRTVEEYRAIYKDPEMRPGVHTYGRGVDIRTSDMPDGLADKLALALDQITYDVARPEMKSVIYGTEKHYDHMHIQTYPRR